MRLLKKLPAGMALLLGLFLFSGCSSERILESDLGLSDAPDWVNVGTQAVDNESGRLLQGVGVASAMNDVSLQRNTADNRARAEIARILSTYIDSTLKDFSQYSGTQNSEAVEQALHSSTRTVLSGARIIARWVDPDTGSLYAFAELDMEQLDKLLSASTALSAELQKYIAEHSDSKFKQLMKETQK